MTKITSPKETHKTAVTAAPLNLNAAFAAMLLLTVVVHCATLTISPPPWQDEVQIVDYGRTLYPASAQWYGVNWSRTNRPIYPLNYIGCLIQETAYRFAGGSMVGPRLAAILGALLAAVAMHLWLIAVGIAPSIAFVAACSFLWDPLFVQGYRGARVDGWCIAFMLLALACVRRSAGREQKLPFLVLAAACVAFSGLTWASAVLLVPLLLHEIYVAARSESEPAEGRSLAVLGCNAVRTTVIVGGAAMAFIALLLLPFIDEARGMLNELTSLVESNTLRHKASLIEKCLGMPSFFNHTPWLPCAALTGVALFGPRSWFIAFAAAVAGTMLSRPYEHRAVYLLPYFAYGFAAAADQAWKSTRTRQWTRVTVVGTSVILLVWSAGISLATRTAVAVADTGRRDPQIIERFVDKITEGKRGTVLLGSWNLYYPFRSRGWAFWGPSDARPVSDIAESLDYDLVVHDESAGTHPLDGQLKQKGYSRRVVQVDAPRERLGLGARGFGPYVVYFHPTFNEADDVAKTDDLRPSSGAEQR